MIGGYMIVPKINCKFLQGTNFRSSLDVDTFKMLISSDKPILFSEIDFPGLGSIRNIWGTVASMFGISSILCNAGKYYITITNLNGNVDIDVGIING